MMITQNAGDVSNDTMFLFSFVFLEKMRGYSFLYLINRHMMTDMHIFPKHNIT